MAIKYHTTNINGVESDEQGSIWLEFLDLIGVPSTYEGFSGKSLIVNETETGLIFSDISGSLNIKVKILSDIIFSDTINPTDDEVYIWASNILNVPESERGQTYLLYQSIENSDISYKYAWRTYNTGTDIGLIRIRDKTNQTLKVNNIQVNYIPTISGNTNNKNEKIIDDAGQHWIIDNNGTAVNLNKTSGNIELINYNKGIITNTEDGKQYLQRTANDGTIITEEI